MRKGICNIDGLTSKDSPKIFYYNSFVNESDVENFDELVKKGIIKEILETKEEELNSEDEIAPELESEETKEEELKVKNNKRTK